MNKTDDDVRARFEVAMKAGDWPDRMFVRTKDDDMYVESATRLAEAGFRAAHADMAGEVRELVDADRMIDRCDAAIESHEANLSSNLLNYQVTDTWADTYKALKRAHYKACIRREIALMKLAKFIHKDTRP